MPNNETIPFRSDIHREVATDLVRNAHATLSAGAETPVNLHDVWTAVRADLPTYEEVFTAAVAICEEHDGERSSLIVDADGEAWLTLYAAARPALVVVAEPTESTGQVLVHVNGSARYRLVLIEGYWTINASIPGLDNVWVPCPWGPMHTVVDAVAAIIAHQL